MRTQIGHDQQNFQNLSLDPVNTKCSDPDAARSMRIWRAEGTSKLTESVLDFCAAAEAIDANIADVAIKAINEELDVESDKQLPKDIKGDNALLVLDRGSIQQGLVQFDLSKQDFEAADKAIDMLDLAHNAGDSTRSANTFSRRLPRATSRLPTRSSSSTPSTSSTAARRR